MIIGLGIDIVEVSRLKNWGEQPGLVERYFHSRELEDARNKSGALSLAARFAAKESFGKALGTGFRGLRLKDIRVVTDKLGRPALSLAGSAEQAFKAIGGEHVHLSLAHENDNAVAVVILEG